MLPQPEHDVLPQRLMHDISALLNDDERRVLAPLGLSPLEYALLQQLDTHEGVRLTSVGDSLLCVKSTVTRTADRLEQIGLVRRLGDPSDRRAKRLVLTDAGRLLRDRACQAQHASLARQLTLLSPEEQAQLDTLLHKLRARLHAALDG